MLLQYVLFLVLFLKNFRCQSESKNPSSISLFYEELYSKKEPRYFPPSPINETELNKVRENLLYFFYDEGSWERPTGDRVPNIDDGHTLVQNLLSFNLPFYGFNYHYIRVSVEGHISFSSYPKNMKHPFIFPIQEWPKENDPALIAVFYGKCRIGDLKKNENESVSKQPGVYIRTFRLNKIENMFEQLLFERLRRDIREGIIGADTFDPLFVIIVTWNKLSIGGGVDRALNKTNTFQLILATDEVRTYAIFNYKSLEWLSDTTSGGDPIVGLGEYPAFVGFNSGNGTRSFEYEPFSQRHTITKLLSTGHVNNLSGRHIFRVDEDILPGNCNNDIDSSNLKLVISPESGNMLGGTTVNVTGPCFDRNSNYYCLFHTEKVPATFIDINRLSCVQPMLMAEGYVHFQLINQKNQQYVTYEGNSVKYYVVMPTQAEIIVEVDDQAYEANPSKITITWDRFNLTTNPNAEINISLYGYRENRLKPEIMLIKHLKSEKGNSGREDLYPLYENEDIQLDLKYVYFGFIKVQLVDRINLNASTPSIWSRPIPLGWYLHKKWEQLYGSQWTYNMCNNWIRNDRYLTTFANELPVCPCNKTQADFDKGRFIPDFRCKKNVDKSCSKIENKNAFHCVNSVVTKYHTGEQQCCYYDSGDLILTYDQTSGSKPYRAHSRGHFPFNEPFKVPSLSQWYHDRIPYYLCCKWQNEQSIGCESYRFERRSSQDCRGYQSPAVATVFGKSHFQTFDGESYTFYGVGDFYLMKVYDKNGLIVQGRFQKYTSQHSNVQVTHMTGVALKERDSDKVEVRLRPEFARSRYVLDVFVHRKTDSIRKAVFFDRPSFKVQRFDGLSIYTPLEIPNQSKVVIVLDTGIGVEIISQNDHIAAKVYLPWDFLNKTRGLLGNWSNEIKDDFMFPNDTRIPTNLFNDNFYTTNQTKVNQHYTDFGYSWMANPNGKSGASIFSPQTGVEPDRNFVVNVTYNRYGEPPCEDTYCSRDFYLLRDRWEAKRCCDYMTSFSEMRKMHANFMVSCGVLETPLFGKKDLYSMTPGSIIKFSCDNDYIIVGDRKRFCLDSGRWNFPEFGYTECLRPYEYDLRVLLVVAFIVCLFILPLLCLICGILVLYYKKYIKTSSFDGTSRLKTGRLARPTSGAYEQEYYTNEPLPGRPNIEFEDKQNDVDLNEAAEIEKKNSKKRPFLTSGITEKYRKYLTSINPKLSLADRYNKSRPSKKSPQNDNAAVLEQTVGGLEPSLISIQPENDPIQPINQTVLKPIRSLNELDFLKSSMPSLAETPSEQQIEINESVNVNSVSHKPATTSHV